MFNFVFFLTFSHYSFINGNQKGVEDVRKIKKLISDAFGFWTANSDLSIREGNNGDADILIDFSM